MSIQKLLYTLQIADNALILGHRISEWCGHGPILEQDIAITNTALDHLGQARSLYQYAATQFNALTPEEKKGLFTSAALQNLVNEGKLLVEQPNKDWAYTVARSFLYDCFSYFFYSALKNSKDETLAAIAEKSLKEVTYHIRWSSEWVIRLGDGTEESYKRMQQAINDRWVYTGELLKMNEADKAMLAEGIGIDLNAISQQWRERVTSVIEEATLTVPPDTWMQEGGKDGRHTEHLGYILVELQFMQRAYPNMEW